MSFIFNHLQHHPQYSAPGTAAGQVYHPTGKLVDGKIFDLREKSRYRHRDNKPINIMQLGEIHDT
jgi:hypothetical protein